MRKKEHFPGAFLNTAFPTILVFLCMLTLLYFVFCEIILFPCANITMVKITAVVFIVVFNKSHIPSLFFFGESLKLLWLSSDMDPNFQEVFVHQERRMFWVVVVLEDEAMTQTQFCFCLLQVSFKIFTYPYFIVISSTSTRFPVSEARKHPHSITLSPPCFTVETVVFGLHGSCFFL